MTITRRTQEELPGNGIEPGRVISHVENFGRIPEPLLVNRDVSDAECRAYAMLTTWDYRRTGRMFRKREDLAESLGWSISKLDVALRALEKHGAIRRIRKGPGACNDIELLSRRLARSDSQESSDLTTLSRTMMRLLQERTQERTKRIALVSLKRLTRRSRRSSMFRRSPRARTIRDELWDSVVAVFPASTPTARGLVGKVVGELAAMDPVPKPGLVTRVGRWVVADTDGKAGPRAIVSSWDRAMRAFDRADPADEYQEMRREEREGSRSR